MKSRAQIVSLETAPGERAVGSALVPEPLGFRIDGDRDRGSPTVRGLYGSREALSRRDGDRMVLWGVLASGKTEEKPA